LLRGSSIPRENYERLASEERRSRSNHSFKYFSINQTYVATVRQRDRRTDGRTDRQTDRRPTVAIPRIALRASGGRMNISVVG